MSEWRNQTPGFNEWLASQLQAYVAHTWPAVKAVAVRFAMRGSIAHMNFLREIMEPRGPAGSTPPGTPSSPLAGAVIINLPMPPAEVADVPMVRGLLDQAGTFDMLPPPANP